MNESELLRLVCEVARLMGWLVYHTHDSRRSPAGFPDLVLARPPRLVFVELKSDKGKLRPEQSVWMATLLRGPGEFYLWRPSDWRSGRIEEVLR